MIKIFITPSKKSVHSRVEIDTICELVEQVMK